MAASGTESGKIIDAIGRYCVTKGRDLIRTRIPAALHPDGEVNADGLANDPAFHQDGFENRAAGTKFMVYIVPISLQLLLG